MIDAESKKKVVDKKRLDYLGTMKAKVTKLATEIAAYNKAVDAGSALIVSVQKAKTIETFDDGVAKYVAGAGKDDKVNVAKMGKPSVHRIAFRKVQLAVDASKKAQINDDRAGKFVATKNKLIDAAKANSGAIAIGLGITALLCAVGGVCCCKYQKTCCFKEEEYNEGGDRAIYKQEVKSKNSQKRHVKDSLVDQEA